MYSYALPDLPGGSTLPPLPRLRINTSHETRESVASFNSDYAVPDSPQEMKEIKNQGKTSKLDKSPICSKPDKDKCQSKELSGDSFRSTKSAHEPYYHVLDSTENASVQNAIENESDLKEAKSYDVAEAVINDAFEGLEDEVTDATTEESNGNSVAEQQLQSVNRQGSHKLAELPFRHSTTSQISNDTFSIDSEEKRSSVQEGDEAEDSGCSSSDVELPERTMGRLPKPPDSSSEYSSEVYVRPDSDTSSLSSATGTQNMMPKEEDYVINYVKDTGNKAGFCKSNSEEANIEHAKTDFINGDNVKEMPPDHAEDNNSLNEKVAGIKIANAELTVSMC